MQKFFNNKNEQIQKTLILYNFLSKDNIKKKLLPGMPFCGRSSKFLTFDINHFLNLKKHPKVFVQLSLQTLKIHHLEKNEISLTYKRKNILMRGVPDLNRRPIDLHSSAAGFEPARAEPTRFQKPKEFDKNNMKKNNDYSTINGNIILIFPLKLYPLESYGRELQHMLKSTLLDN
ncbi:hypothetical protein H8356DRAFT_1427570 [Neocallimastix lanati (nom. inval.)]|nr:hypothetical protein H8356DRAFT_1427570 [Neocallimastix sp. JGI-2020a]